MNFNGFFNFEEFMKNCGFNMNNMGSSCNCSTIPGAPQGCNDIPGGFQDLNPELFIIMGEILGNVVAGNIPFNVQNALGNWLQLVGQVILTYNAQQQYFQGGPGRYYDIRNKNVSNPFCPDPPDTSGTAGSNAVSGKSSSGRVKSETGTDEVQNDIKNKGNKTEEVRNKEIEELKRCIGTLLNEVQEIKKEINCIKYNDK